MSDLLSEKCGQPSVLRAEDWSEMAERICAWPLPDDLCADAIACKPGAPHRTGTNLITTTQALAMLDYACKPIIDAALTAELEAELMHEREAIDESAKTISRQIDEIKRQLHDNVGLAKELVRERSHSADLSMDLKCAEAELAAAKQALLVPGEMRCAKCNFGLIRTNLYVNNGTTGPGSNETEPCPNGCGPLWPETWEHSAREAWSRLETMEAERDALRDQVARLVGAIEQAPHGAGCLFGLKATASMFYHCNCWKRTALGGK